MKNVAAYAILALTVAFALSPAFTDPFMGFTEDQLPNPQIDPPIQPAGYAFAIWGVIYLWLILSAGFGALQRHSDANWHRARLPLGISLLIGVPWLAIANASAIWSTVAIVLMAAGAIQALLHAPARDRWLFLMPVGLYAGWLTAASFVSLGSTMAGYGILTDSLGWAYLGIVGAFGVTAFFLVRSGAPSYGLAVIWALVGIIAANGASGVSAAATVGAATLAALTWRTAQNLSLSS